MHLRADKAHLGWKASRRVCINEIGFRVVRAHNGAQSQPPGKGEQIKKRESKFEITSVATG